MSDADLFTCAGDPHTWSVHVGGANGAPGWVHQSSMSSVAATLSELEGEGFSVGGQRFWLLFTDGVAYGAVSVAQVVAVTRACHH